ncbi:DUF551 domain-containing protein [Enterobacter hormaechei]
MSTLTKEWLLKTIAELEEERDATPGAVNEDAAMALAAMRLALASLEADGALANEGTITATQFKPVADLYEVTVPGGRSTTFTKDAAEASDCRVMGWSVQEYVKLERYQAAMLQGADGKPELTVWYGAMPESNGKANWTAILHRKGEGRCMNGFTIDRSEYPGRVLYAADRVRYLIGEKSERPSILDYDADAHSGYVKPGNSPVIPDGWVACSERMPDIDTEIFYFCKDDGLRDCGIVSSSNFSDSGDAQLYVHAEGYDLRLGVDITHWMPLPAAPQQEVK